jgi:hypothetical protein
VTIETGAGATFRNLESDFAGAFRVRMMLPGTYRILVEVVGYQPVRRSGIVVAAGRSTTVAFTLEKRPPPITSVTELSVPGTSSGAMGRIVAEQELRSFDYRRDATDLSRGVTEVATTADGRSGYALAGGGLNGRWSRLFVDGLPEQLLRHPGVPNEPSSAPVFPREGVDQALIFASTPDLEWRGTAGTVLGLETRRGSNTTQFSPFASFSGSSLGGNKDLNPADSSATSFQVGATLSGALVRDTAHYFFHADYQSLRTPSAYPWESDTSRYLGQPAALRETLRAIGTDSFHTSLNGGVSPVVRTWKGGSGLGRVDWQLSPTTAVMMRAGFTSWKETNPQLGTDPGNGFGSALKGRDISGALSLTWAGPSVSNELRAGFSGARREWTGSALPATTLVAEGIGIGGNPALPALFDSQILSLSDGIQWSTGRHAIKGGISTDYTNYRQNYRYGSQGIFQFGSLDEFGAARGTYFQPTASVSEAKFSLPDVGLYFEDSYSLSTEFTFLFGLRYQVQALPKNKVLFNPSWFTASGLRADSLPHDRRGLQPRVGFVWDVQNRGNLVVQGSAGIYTTGMDLANFAEVMLNSGDITVRRGQGQFGNWPDTPNSVQARQFGQRLTYFSGARSFHTPRTFKADFGISRVIQGGVTLQLAGSYHHTDYLSRRVDLNRSASASGQTQEGRPVYGTLTQQGGLVSPSLASSRRFQGFDLVSVFAPTGFSDYYEVTAAIDRQVARSLSVQASYTYSHTRDNLVGALSPDPADQLSPFPDGIGGAAWDEAKSDIDIPHRAALTLEYRGGGKYPLTVAARGRWRSGLPFTPGFRQGVDVNGDLSGGNDPVQASGVPTATGSFATCDGSSVGGFAARNSCRDKSVGAVDARLALRLPVRAGGAGLSLTVDAFNIVASSTGLVDHAAMLVDPTKTLTTDLNGAVTLPLIANPHFGSLLSRRGEPRLVRFGLRVEY